jgi:antitoxin YefM
MLRLFRSGGAMKSVSDIAFANNIGTYQRLISENAETFLIESSNPDLNLVAISAREWEAQMETVRIYENDYLRHKIFRGIGEIKRRQDGR